MITRLCACGCGKIFEIDASLSRKDKIYFDGICKERASYKRKRLRQMKIKDCATPGCKTHPTGKQKYCHACAAERHYQSKVISSAKKKAEFEAGINTSEPFGVCGCRECKKPLYGKVRKYCDNVCGSRERHLADAQRRCVVTRVKPPIATPVIPDAAIGAGSGVKSLAQASLSERDWQRIDDLVQANKLLGYNPHNPEPYVRFIREARGG